MKTLVLSLENEKKSQIVHMCNGRIINAKRRSWHSQDFFLKQHLDT